MVWWCDGACVCPLSYPGVSSPYEPDYVSIAVNVVVVDRRQESVVRGGGFAVPSRWRLPCWVEQVPPSHVGSVATATALCGHCTRYATFEGHDPTTAAGPTALSPWGAVQLATGEWPPSCSSSEPTDVSDIEGWFPLTSSQERLLRRCSSPTTRKEHGTQSIRHQQTIIHDYGQFSRSSPWITQQPVRTSDDIHR